jgi:coenzyme F420-reducing hydrogenase beta subunit
MKISKLGDACCGCGACAARCPKSCISMQEDEFGFPHPVIDACACVGCHACESVCPALSAGKSDETLEIRWAKGKSSELLEASSSGGIFGLLAETVIANGGVVCGAAWADGCRRVEHVLVEDAVSLDRVMRSKYVQSCVGREVYAGVRDAIRSGRRVLFAGTACQVAGLKRYLGKTGESALLLTVDVICHGVPAPRLWSEWIDYKNALRDSNVCDVNMRSKTTGWLSYSAMYEHIAEKDPFSSCESTIFNQDWYMKAFLANASLRSSCFQCPAKRGCGSDITLGDFWGFQSIHPEVDYSKGVSAVICNTQKGESAFNDISRLTLNGPATLEEVIAGNPSLVSSVAPYPKRDEFLKDVASGTSIPDLKSKWDFRPTLMQRIRGKLSGIKRRFKKIIVRGA